MTPWAWIMPTRPLYRSASTTKISWFIRNLWALIILWAGPLRFNWWRLVVWCHKIAFSGENCPLGPWKFNRRGSQSGALSKQHRNGRDLHRCANTPPTSGSALELQRFMNSHAKNRKLAAGCCRGVKVNVSKRTNSEWTRVTVSPTGLVLHWNFPFPSQLHRHLALPPAPHLQSPQHYNGPGSVRAATLSWLDSPAFDSVGLRCPLLSQPPSTWQPSVPACGDASAPAITALRRAFVRPSDEVSVLCSLCWSRTFLPFRSTSEKSLYKFPFCCFVLVYFQSVTQDGFISNHNVKKLNFRWAFVSILLSAELKVLCNLGLKMETLNLAVNVSPMEAKALLISFPPFAFVQPGRGLKPLTFGTWGCKFNFAVTALPQTDAPRD